MRSVAATIFALMCTPAVALLGLSNRREVERARERRAAEVTCGAASGACSYVAGGRLYKSFTPPGVAYRVLRRPLLSANERVALALAASAAGAYVARVAVSSNGPAADVILSLGRLTARMGDNVRSSFASLDARRLRAKEQRERESRRKWLRDNAKPAKMYVRS
jgi:hypothetical protein